MAFPNTIETGANDTEKARIGLAGPTADIGHKPAHAAAGLPAMIIELQTQIGTGRTVQTWTPSWPTGATPSSVIALWARYGPLIWFRLSVGWGSAGSSPSANNLTISNCPWGTLPNKQLIHANYYKPSTTYRSWVAANTAGTFTVYAEAAAGGFNPLPAGTQLEFNGILYDQ